MTRNGRVSKELVHTGLDHAGCSFARAQIVHIETVLDHVSMAFSKAVEQCCLATFNHC